jgi:spermidine/putrescine-binding protein
MKKIIFLLILLLSSPSLAEGAQQKTINILTWWGYLDHPEIIRSVEKACNIKISYDQYYSNDEFLRRWRTQKNSYDIIIFSNTIYKMIQNEIPNIRSSKLSREARLYHPVIRKKYLSLKTPENVLFFMHSLTGFIYNPKTINLSANDSIFTIFQKADKKLAILIDDPVEAKKLLEIVFNTKDKNVLSYNRLKKIFPNTTIYIGNGFNQIYKDPDFAFAYTWSGTAFNKIYDGGLNYNFLIHPQLSYISSDLLAQTSNNQQSMCAASALTSREVLSLVENDDYYFSSYTDISNIKNKNFRKIYQDFMINLPRLTWIESTDANEFDRLNTSWDLIKATLADNGKQL